MVGVIRAHFHLSGKSHNLMKELIMSVKALAIYSATGCKNLAGIRSEPFHVSDHGSFSSRKTSWNITGLKVKVISCQVVVLL